MKVRGLMFMQGNQPEDLAEFAGGAFNPAKRTIRPVTILQRTFVDHLPRRCTAMDRIFIPAYCFAIP